MASGIDIRLLDEDNLDQAMQLVTESFDLDVRRGWREDDFEEDWRIAYSKLSHVAAGGLYLGLVGFQHYNQPVALSVVVESPAYPEGTGVWDWFFVSPRAKKSPFPGELARITVVNAIESGAKNLVAFVGSENPPVERMMRIIGMKPVEVEYRSSIQELNQRFLRPHRQEVNGNGKQTRN